MKLSLLVNEGPAKGRTVAVKMPQFLIGRDPQCQLRAASPIISKRHCAILVRGDKVYLRDLESTNGSFVNDQPIKGEVELHHEDHLKVGPLSFIIQIESTVPAVKAASKPRPQPVVEMGEEEIAQMLLEEEAVADELLESDEVASSASASTLIDVPSPVPAETQLQQDPSAQKSESPPKPKMDTRAAAEALLSKYTRRR